MAPIFRSLNNAAVELYRGGDSPEKHLDGTASQFGLRSPTIERTLFRAGVSFHFEQTVNSTVIVFDRPETQAKMPAATDDETVLATSNPFNEFNKVERIALQIAHDSGRVTKRSLMEQAGVGRTKAIKTLKRLSKAGVLAWVGKSNNDPHQYYRLS